jgi:hypothetical protein
MTTDHRMLHHVAVVEDLNLIMSSVELLGLGIGGECIF